MLNCCIGRDRSVVSNGSWLGIFNTTVVSLFLSECKACSIILNALESLDAGFIYTRQKRFTQQTGDKQTSPAYARNVTNTQLPTTDLYL